MKNIITIIWLILNNVYYSIEISYLSLTNYFILFLKNNIDNLKYEIHKKKY